MLIIKNAMINEHKKCIMKISSMIGVCTYVREVNLLSLQKLFPQKISLRQFSSEICKNFNTVTAYFKKLSNMAFG